MKFDFSTLPFRSRAFNEEPMKFVEPEPKSFLSAMIDLIMIETGKRKARENWQKAQLRNLLKHAHERSPFWRKRIATRKLSAVTLSDLPILTRNDLIYQVKSEGPLLGRNDGSGVKMHSTSGSSGTPVEFFISHMNSDYSQARSLAQYLMEGRDLSLNRVRVRPLDYNEAKDLRIEEKKGFHVEVSDSDHGCVFLHLCRPRRLDKAKNRSEEYRLPRIRDARGLAGHQLYLRAVCCRPIMLNCAFCSSLSEL